MKTYSNGIKYNILLLVVTMCFVFDAFPQREYNPTVTEEINDEEIIWTNSLFEREIRRRLFEPSSTIRQSDLDTITDLDLSSGAISNISDIIYFRNLRTLDLGRTYVRDISPLADLPNLTELRLNGTDYISDISVLAGLTNLTELHLNGTDISDISVLAGLTNLTKLSLNDSISDISALSSLINLTTLSLLKVDDVTDGELRDISALANLPNLNTVYFGLSHKHGYDQNNTISDWSPVDHVENVYGRPVTTEEIDGIKYYVYEQKSGYTLYSTETISAHNGDYHLWRIWTRGDYDFPFKLVYISDAWGKTVEEWTEEWEKLELILQIKNEEGKLLSLDYKNFFYEESYVNKKSICLYTKISKEYFCYEKIVQKLSETLLKCVVRSDYKQMADLCI